MPLNIDKKSASIFFLEDPASDWKNGASEVMEGFDDDFESRLFEILPVEMSDEMLIHLLSGNAVECRIVLVPKHFE